LPNLHWFGTEADHAIILSNILGLDAVQVFELYSQYDTPIRTFTNVDDILAEFQRPHEGGSLRAQIDLNLWVNGAGPKPDIERTRLNPETCGGHRWRERSGSVGFVQLFLARMVDDHLIHCQTNTVSAARMGAVDGLYIGQDGAVWDVGLKNRFSGKLNRMIKKKAVGKVMSSYVLPGAAKLWEQGITFSYHWSKAKTPELYQEL